MVVDSLFYLAAAAYVMCLFAWRINWLLKQHDSRRPTDQALHVLGAKRLYRLRCNAVPATA